MSPYYAQSHPSLYSHQHIFVTIASSSRSSHHHRETFIFIIIIITTIIIIIITTRLKGGRHEKGFGLFLKELKKRRLESYCLQTTEALAYWMSLMHLPPTLPSWARSEASIFSQLKIVRSERDVVAVARFSNFKSL